MATSGSLNSTAYQGRYVKFDWSLVSTNPVSNVSTISWTLKGAGTITTGSNWFKAAPFIVTINGNVEYSSNTRIELRNGTLVASGTSNILHDEDGTKTFSVTIEAAIYSGSINCTGTGLFTLDPIPRVSKFTKLTSGTLGVAQTIEIEKAVSGFTNSIGWIADDSHYGTLVEKSTDTSFIFTPPMNLAEVSPNSTSVTVIFVITTYSGDNEIGENMQFAAMSIPDSVKPSISSVSVSDPDGHVAKYGGYIQNKSSVSVTVNASGSYGSNIDTYNSIIGNVQYTAKSFVSNVLTNYGPNDISSIVTDSRGRISTEAQTTINVLQYSAPVISLLSVYRCDEDGTESPTGSFAKVVYSHTITDLGNKNSKTIRIGYKKTSTNTYAYTDMPSVYQSTQASYIFPADDGSAYDVRMVVSDDFGSTIQNTSVSTAFCLMHYAPSGKGITFGGVSNDDGFHVKMNADFNGDLEVNGRNLKNGVITLPDGSGFTAVKYVALLPTNDALLIQTEGGSNFVVSITPWG